MQMKIPRVAEAQRGPRERGIEESQTRGNDVQGREDRNEGGKGKIPLAPQSAQTLLYSFFMRPSRIFFCWGVK